MVMGFAGQHLKRFIEADQPLVPAQAPPSLDFPAYAYKLINNTRSGL